MLKKKILLIKKKITFKNYYYTHKYINTKHIVTKLKHKKQIIRYLVSVHNTNKTNK